MKKIISLMFMLCLVVSLCTVSAYADGKDVSTEAEFLAALGDDGVSEISLQDNITLTSMVNVNKAVTLVFNEKSIYGGNNLSVGAEITVADEGHIYGLNSKNNIVPPDGCFAYVGDTGLYLSPDADSFGLHIVPVPTDIPASAKNIKSSYKGIGTQAPELNFAMQFTADGNSVTMAQAAYYADWVADFVISVNKKATFCATDGVGGEVASDADGYLAGQYANPWTGENWLTVPANGLGGSVTLNPGEEFEIMGFVYRILGQDARFTVYDVFTQVGVFNCGLYFSDEFVKANPDVEVELSLKIYPPDSKWNGTDAYVNPNGGAVEGLTVSGDVYSFPKPAAAPVANRYNVPSTADNSNVPLWTGLFLGFAAVAVLTMGKKRRS